MWIHRWSSLVSTLFLLMLCLTGLPLIFHDELESFGSAARDAEAGPPSAAAGLPIDMIIERGLAANGGGVPLFIGFSQDSPEITVTVGPSPNAAPDSMRLFSFNRATGEAMGEVVEQGLLHILFRLHVDLFLGPWGSWFLGAMGLLFVLAILSGCVLYVPFMRRLAFGSLRLGAGQRVRTLDWHNLAGALVLGWALVVGVTGIINAYEEPLTAQWRTGALAQMTGVHAGEDPLPPEEWASVDQALTSARTAVPGFSPQFIAFPGGAWSSPRHYAIFFQGDTPLTRHLLTPALVDVRSGRVTDVQGMPPLNQALMLSKPLHFGDYGGLGLKLAWAGLDLLTIWVLVSGLMLWWQKRRPRAVES